MILPSKTHTNARAKSRITAMLWLIAGLGITVTLLVSLAHTAPAQAGAARYGVKAPSCDPEWVVQSPVSPTYGLLQGLAVVSSNDIWATGRSPDNTLTEHWNGDSWGVVPNPNTGAQSFILYGISAVSTNDVWAVGWKKQDVDSYDQTLIEHWDGTAWTIVPSPNMSIYNNVLFAVAAISVNDVWAVGSYATSLNNNQPLIIHWNGTAWSVVTSPNPPGATHAALNGIEALSTTDIWAVGSSTNGTLIQHWNGTAWSIVSSPNAGTNATLYKVDAVSANDIWAVGGSSNGTLIEHWDGLGWSIVTSPNVGTVANILFGVAVVSATDAWAVGYYANTNPPDGTLVTHWNGSSWSVVNSPNPGNDGNYLSSIVAVSATDVWAVGFYNNDQTALQPMSQRYNPCTATPTPSPTGTPGTCPVQFPDVPPGSTFYDFVRCLACRGIVSGLPNGTFGVNNPVTRGQLSKIVSNAAGYNEDHSGQSFEDVPVGSTFHQFLERLVSRGHISGFACGGTGEPCVPPDNRPYFRPGANVTRGQTSKIVASARGLPAPPAGQQTFEDVAEGSTFWRWIEALAANGAISGYPCGSPEPCVPPLNRPYFRPNNQVTRGQAAKIVANAFFPECVTP